MAHEQAERFSHDQIAVQTQPLPGWHAAFVLLTALRPRQWLKNGLLFVPLAFTLNLHHVDLVARTFAAFVCFCALSSAGYLLNDVRDVQADRAHPTKRSRPIASGLVSVPAALALAFGLALAGLAGCFWLSPQFGGTGVAYLGMTAVYTLWMKHQILLDVFGIAAGFVIRAAAGAVVISVPISPWLYSATMLGALLIALGKRRADLQTLGAQAVHHRRNLDAYTVELVDQLIAIISGAALMTYALYTFSAENLPRDHSMMVTIPVVMYGLFRYLYLLHVRGTGGAPEELLLRDTPLLTSIAVWAALAVALLYLGSAPL